MSLTVKDLTHLQKEVQKARNIVDKMLDFVDLMNSASDKIDGEIEPPTKNIKQNAELIAGSVNEIKDLIDTQLNKIPVDQEEVKSAAHKLLLYQGSKEQVLIWAQQQKGNHKPESYWWKYWQGIYEEISESGKG